MMRRLLAGVAVALAVGLFATGCGRGDEATIAARDSTPQEPDPVGPVFPGKKPLPTIPECKDDAVGYTLAAETLNAYANRATLAVVGTVDKTESPRRVVQSDGSAIFVGDMYITADRVAFASSEDDVKAGETVKVRLWASDACGPSSYSEVEGSLKEGGRMVAILDAVEVDFGGKPERVLRLSGHYFTNWTVEVDNDGVEQARNSAPGWSASLDTLLRRVDQERAAGRLEKDAPGSPPFG